MITNDVSDYIKLLVRIVHITCNRPLFCQSTTNKWTNIISKPTAISSVFEWTWHPYFKSAVPTHKISYSCLLCNT